MKLNILEKELDPFLNILDVDVPPELEKIVPTGVKFMDNALNGGFTPSTVMMLSGSAGSGKTTLSIMMADSLTAQGNQVLINGLEESIYQVRKTAKRLNIKSGFCIGQNISVEKIIAQSTALIKKNPEKQLTVIVDSLQCVNDGKYGDNTNGMTAVRSVEMLSEFAKTKCEGQFPIVIMLTHATKGSKSTFIGKNSILHTVDVHAHLKMDENPKSETFGHIILDMRKNRFGGAGRNQVLDMKSEGLVACEEFANSEETEE